MPVAVKKSELQELLEKNISLEGLTLEEKNRAKQLIVSPELSDENCCVCTKKEPAEKAIFDTGFCPGHAYYALETRK